MLKRLKQSGLLVSEKKRREEEERKERERAALIAAAAKKRPPSPDPIACDSRFLNNIEQRPVPLAPLEQFSIRVLSMYNFFSNFNYNCYCQLVYLFIFRRYDSVIEQLHRTRVTCQYCGIAFHEIYSEAYQRHADGHLRDTLKVKENKYARSNPWIMNEVN